MSTSIEEIVIVQSDLFEAAIKSEESKIDQLLSADEIYSSEDPTLFLSLSEDARFDRKSFKVEGKTLATYLSAFGNGPCTDGGVVVIGISDKKQIEGCKSLSDRQLQEIEEFGRHRCPSGRVETRRLEVINSKKEQDFIILGRVQYVPNRLVELTDGSAYQRIGHEARKLLEPQKQAIRIDKGEVSLELEPTSLEYPDEFREREIKKFAAIIRSGRDGSSDISDEKILETMHLGSFIGGKFVPNNAGALLFAKDPQKIFPGAYVHFLRYNGTEEGSGSDYNVTKDRISSGTILEQIESTQRLLDASLREFTTYRNGKFVTEAEYPRDAWYELLVNACVHRSYYTKNAGIFVKMFDDRLVIESPGGFMPEVTANNIYEMHRPRNPHLMLALREYGEVRCINEGTKRIKKEMLGAKLPAPEFYNEIKGATSVRATLKNDINNRTNSLDSEAYKQIGDALALSLTLDERKVINYVIEHGKINVSAALRIIKTTRWHTAKDLLDGLVSRGVLDYMPGKGKRAPNSYYSMRTTSESVS